MNPDNSNFLVKGCQIHWYEIDSVLGQGGFGITYAAIDTNLKKKVAIKEFFPSELAIRTNSGNVTVTTQSGESKKLYEWGLTSFLREAQTLANFKHKNIVFVYSVFEANNTAYMVMEYLDGPSLRDAFKQNLLLDEEALKKLTLELMDGLRLVHRAGFIHRDIKPSNIILRNSDEPVLLDFGSARRAFDSKTAALTKLVSSGYSPFEQYSGLKDDQGPWTDIYAMAATLYKAITGKAPVDSLTRANKILTGKPDPLVPAGEIAKKKYSPEFLNAIDRALALQPKDRPQTIDEWMQLLAGRSIDSIYPVSGGISTSGHDTRNTSGFHSDGKHTVVAEHHTRQELIGAITTLRESAKRYSIELAVSAGRYMKGIAAAIGQSWSRLGSSVNQFFIREIEQRKRFWVVTAACGVLIAAGITFRAEIRSNIDLMAQTFSEYQAARKKRDKIENLLEVAEDHLAQDRLSKPRGANALESFRQVIEIDPGNTEAFEGLEKVVQRYLSLAASARSRNQFDQAEAYLNDVNQIVPNAEIVQDAYREVVAARQEYLKKQQEEAQKRKRLEELLALAQTGLQEMRLAEVQTYLQEAEQLMPGDEQVARFHRQLTEIEAAQQKRAKIEELLALGRADLKADRLIEPDSENARERFRAVLTMDPENREAQDGLRVLAQRLLDLADEAILNLRLDQAERYLQEAAQLLPGDARIKDARARLGQLRTEQQTTAKIEDLLSEARADLQVDRLIEPGSENALERYRSVLALDPDNREAQDGIRRIGNRLLDLSEGALSNGRPDQAESYLQEADKLLPGDARVKDARARLGQLRTEQQTTAKIEDLLSEARADLQADRLIEPGSENALERYRSVLALDPDNREAQDGIRRIGNRLLDLSVGALSNRQTDQAESYLQEADKLLPGDARVKDARARLGQLRTEQQTTAKIEDLLSEARADIKANRLIEPRGKNALERYRSVLELDAENRQAQDGIQQIARRILEWTGEAVSKKQYDRAEKYLQVAEQLLPGDRQLAQTRADLRQLKGENTQKERVDELLRLAKQDLKATRLTAPAGNNALERYRAVIELDPTNREAKLGIKKLVERYATLIDRAIQDEQFDKAMNLLENAESAFPGEATLRRAKERLSGSIEKSKLAEAERKEEEERIKQEQAELETKKQQEIESLFERAERNFRKDNLIAPRGDNALDQYRAVLERDPGNRKATQGITRIAERFLELASKAQKSKEFDEADKLLRNAERVAPSSSRVREARGNLKAEIDRAQKAASVAEKEREKEKAAKHQPPPARDVSSAKDTMTTKSPALNRSNLFGSWCGEGFTLRFANSDWTFEHGSGGTTFPVRQYKISGDRIVMYWEDRKNGSMITEFGNFSEDRSKLVQIRGKMVDEGDWHYYNRGFSRCK